MKPHFIGCGSMTPALDRYGMPRYRRRLWKRIPLFEFTNGRRTPLTFLDANGTLYQPDRHFVTDGGSVPPILWGCPVLNLGPWDFPRAYPFHDSGFTYGGLYVATMQQPTFRFHSMGRHELNALLETMIPADGGEWLDVKTVHAGLVLGSWSCWDPLLQERNRQRDKVRAF